MKSLFVFLNFFKSLQQVCAHAGHTQSVAVNKGFRGIRAFCPA